MPRTKEQFEKIRESRKQHIMNTAMELFAKEGYGHVSIALLAKQAGISKGLMYNYFDSKEQLLKEILDTGMEEVMQYFDPNHDGVLTTEEFILFIRKTFQLMREDKKLWMKFFRLLIQPKVSPFLQDSSMAKFMEQYYSMFETYFRNQGFEDPMLEVLNLFVLIEGFGMMMIFYDGITALPEELFIKFEERIIKTYTRK